LPDLTEFWACGAFPTGFQVSMPDGPAAGGMSAPLG